MKIIQVGGHSWACVGGGEDVLHSYGANQGFVGGAESCVVVDSGFHNVTARKVLGRVRKFRPKRLLLVNTHYHSDHVFGNSLFSEKGATVLSHVRCRRTMKRVSPGLLEKYRRRDMRLRRLLGGVRLSLPTVTYTDRVVAHLDDEVDAEIFHPGFRAHTDGDSIIYVPTDRVVFAGDVLWVGYHPNLEDSSIEGQVRALRMILKRNPRKVVPGHGPVGGIAEVQNMIRYLQELDRNLRALSGERFDLDEVLRRAIPSWAEGWRLRRLAESYVRRVWARSQVGLS